MWNILFINGTEISLKRILNFSYNGVLVSRGSTVFFISEFDCYMLYVVLDQMSRSVFLKQNTSQLPVVVSIPVERAEFCVSNFCCSRQSNSFVKHDTTSIVRECC